MSVDTPIQRDAGARASAVREESRGGGWVAFAGIMLMIAGLMNSIGGIAAIDDANFFVANTHYVFGDLNTWGWIILVLGCVQVLSAFGIWARNGFARFVGVTCASTNALAQLLLLPAYPLWSLALFSLDILIVYGLVAYGGKEEAY